MKTNAKPEPKRFYAITEPESAGTLLSGYVLAQLFYRRKDAAAKLARLKKNGRAKDCRIEQVTVEK